MTSHDDDKGGDKDDDNKDDNKDDDDDVGCLRFQRLPCC